MPMPLCLIIDAYSTLSGMVFERLGQLPLVTSRNLGKRTRGGAKNPVQRCLGYTEFDGSAINKHFVKARVSD